MKTSDKVRAEEEHCLRAQLKQAEKMQAVGLLAGGIAHDFNNILGAILGYGELAQRRATGDGDMTRYLDTIMGAGNRAKSLVTQILSYSRAEGGEKFPVIVAPIAQEVADLLKGSMPIALELNFVDECTDATVLGDPTRMHQLLINLCTNAIHSIGEGGVLELGLACETVAEVRKVRSGEIAPGEYVRVWVKDSGHGIAAEVIDRIFEPFFTTKPPGRGTGLGLVHPVHEQRVTDVASELGKGTTFTGLRTCAEEGRRGKRLLRVRGRSSRRGRLGRRAARARGMLAQLGHEPVGQDSRGGAEDPRRSAPPRRHRQRRGC